MLLGDSSLWQEFSVHLFLVTVTGGAFVISFISTISLLFHFLFTAHIRTESCLSEA